MRIGHLTNDKPCRVFLPSRAGGHERGARRSFPLLGVQNMGCSICATGHSQGAQQPGGVLKTLCNTRLELVDRMQPMCSNLVQW